MDSAVKKAIIKAVKKEPFAQILKMQLITLEDGYAMVEMTYDPAIMNNIYARAHGGAIYGLLDEAFQAAAQTDGTIAVAININVIYVSSPEVGIRLKAEAQRISQTKKTAGYDIKVTDPHGQIIATCQALAYQTGKPIPFL
jgi:acyl-CoA thioesterase